MGLTVTKTGPYFNGSGQPVPNNQTEVKFSQLRDTFRLNNPTGSISASELLRDIDTNSSDPIVPDATENSNIASNTLSAIAAGTIAPNLNWEVSQFFGAIKFFDVEQDASDTNANFNISALSEFNSNLGKTIKKKFTLRGTHTSTNTSIAAAQILSDAWNLTMEIHGNFYGAGGVGGVQNDVSGKPGGHAISISGGRVYFDIQPNAKIWAGGGGGEFGGDGTPGAAGTCEKIVERTKCPDRGSPSCPDPFVQIGGIRDTGICCQKQRKCRITFRFLGFSAFCWNVCVNNTKAVTCKRTDPSPVPATVIGGNGASGRGFNNFSGSLIGSSGQTGNCPDCASLGSGFTLVGGSGTCSGDGENGGNGGDWGQNGGNTASSGNGGQGGSAIEAPNATIIVQGKNTDTVKGATP